MILNIIDIAKKIGLSQSDLLLYGDDKAKIKESTINSLKDKDSKFVLITAITPTKAGEGKTLTAISLNDGLRALNKNSIVLLREPSLGPTFGVKGGASGGGKASIEPHNDINLHFTGDFHALTSSINLISACIDNEIYQGNELNLDPSRILWKRALDCNDRELRNVEIGVGGGVNGITRIDHFTITAASELMAIYCLATSKEDFKRRVKNILIGYTFNDEPVYLESLHIEDAVMALMDYALLPNLVQSGENNPVLIQGGPFANIAHGCASMFGSELARKLSDIVIEEAGFASDLGAEKFYDIKCRKGNINPSCTVLVATIRALKEHGGVAFEDLSKENIEALKEGSKNLLKHYSNLKRFKVPVIVAINHFASDTEEEIKTLEKILEDNAITYSFMDGYLMGSKGSIDLANKVLHVLETKTSKLEYAYSLDESIESKINKLAKNIYNAKDVNFSEDAIKHIKDIEKLGKSNLPICVAKTQSSLSDDPKLLNVPSDYTFNVKDVYLSNGAEFIVVISGKILVMPGLPKVPRAKDFKYE